MTDTQTAPAGGADAIAPVTAPTPASEGFSAREAHQAYTARRDKAAANPTSESKAPEPAPEEAAPEPELAKADDAQPETADPVEPTKDDDAQPEEVDPVEPPRSWPKERKEAFKLLPPALQRDVAELERSREVEIRRGQNEVAEKLKGLTAKEQQAEQVRQQYEHALPYLLETIQASQNGEFADIRTQEDVNKLANEDWPRFARWQAHRMQVDAISRETQAAQARQTQEYQKRWAEFSSKEDQLAIEKIPELSDKTKAAKISDGALSMLEKVGFSRNEFAKAWMGEASISPRDHRWQQVMLKAALYDEAKATAPKATPKPVPQVQKPGVAQPKGASADANTQALRNKLTGSGSVNDAFALYQAKKKASA